MIESFSFGPFIGGGFIALLGMAFFKQAIRDLKDFQRSKNWPFVKGKMLKSEVWRPQSTSAHRVWSVEYEYKIDDKKYTGRKVALYTPVFKEIQKWQEKRQEGDIVNVYYEPDTPSKSLLIVGGREEKRNGEIILSIGAIIVGLIVMVGGGFLGYLS